MASSGYRPLILQSSSGSALNCALSLFFCACLLPAAVMARPLGSSRALSKIESLDLSGPGSDRLGISSSPVFSVATGSTTFFGGTFWAADSMRWEALENGVWTFDTGVGSSIVPPGGPGSLSAPASAWVNPFKHPGLHATMEGWIGWDNTFTSAPYFRRLAVNDPRWGPTVCVGTPAGLGGNVSFWAGVFPDEANALCYGAGQGYGNAWKVCIEHPFNYQGGSLVLAFTYRNETEEDFDYSSVYCDTSGVGDDVEVLSYTGSRYGYKYVGLNIGYSLPVVPKPIKIQICVASDGAWSDQDGLNPTTCGAFAVDDIHVWGTGINYFADFENSDDGWTVSPAEEGLGGEWSSLYHVNNLPSPLTFCACALSESVLAFPNDNNQHSNYQDNLAASPWIDLAQSQKVGYQKFIQASIYAELPLRNYVFGQFLAQWYPETCLKTGKVMTSPWMSTGFVYDFGGTPVCSTPGKPLQIDLSSFVSPGAEQLRIALGVISYCQFFSTCTQLSNTTPWFDNVSVGVHGTPGVPFIASDEVGRAQDNFPANGLMSVYVPGRIDSNNIQGAERPENGTTLGDTLVALCNLDNSEVYVHFKVTPGPGTNISNFNAWNGKHAVSPIDPTFRYARMDTAECGLGGPVKGRWMTTYHEADPNFSVNDRLTDPMDVTPTGGQWRLFNDIFRDNLLTGGARIDYFFTANQVGVSSYSKDPVAGSYEVEILPSSYDANGQFNCTLYVDHYNRGAQPYMEAALGSILGFGSANNENTRWDRYDVNAAASQQASLGRPPWSDYGITIYQLLEFRNVLWDSGDLNAFNLTEQDANVFNPWLTLRQWDNKNLYLSGDGLVYSVIHEAESEPSARRLIEDLAGVTLRTTCSSGAFSAGNCPAAGAPVDMTECVNLDPVSGAVVADHPARTVGHVAQGNGCPDRRSFDVLSLLTPEFGLSSGDEQYISPVKRANFASVTTDAAPSGTLHYRIITDGTSVHYRRDLGTVCDFEAGGAAAVTERMREVSTYFHMTLETGCNDYPGAVGLPVVPQVPASTSLGDFSPNPMTSRSASRLNFILAQEGRATLQVLDLQGRLVKTLFDGPAQAGKNEVFWDGTNASSHPVANGIYFYRLKAQGVDISKKIVIAGKGK